MTPGEIANAIIRGEMSIGDALDELEVLFGNRTDAQNFLQAATPEQYTAFISQAGGQGQGLLGAPAAGQQLRPSDVFRGFLANQPGAQNPLLRQAAASREIPARTQFLLQSPDISGGAEEQNAFARFLGSGRALEGGELQQRLGLIGNITGLGQPEFEAQFGSSGLAPALRERFLSGDQALSNQLRAVQLPFQQFAGSPEARHAFESQVRTVFDRFINQNPEGNFLNFARDRNLFGAFS
tara:strand:+ start:22 stop:738 length:717 start_codon:yes stop_codon:yes gene_type:complete